MSIIIPALLEPQGSILPYVMAPSAFEKWLSKWFDPDHKDEYNRSKYAQKRDKLFGVEKYQLEQRYGHIQHKVVANVPEPRNFVHKVEDWCDAKFGWLYHKPTPQQVMQKPVPFDYSRCW